MPGSAISAGSGSHCSGSSAARRARTRQYRTVALGSQIDESLFGEAHSQTKRTQMLEDKWKTDAAPIERQAKERSAGRKKSKKNSKNTVQVITKDLIRNLIVAGEDPSGNSMVLSGYEYHRLLNAARVISADERKLQYEAWKDEKDSASMDVQERRTYMKMKDQQRRKNEKLTDIEIEEKEKREHLKLKAHEVRQEQEDEIKRLNELILNAKCHAIRDAQILERDQIKKEMEEEERRLDVMMEVDRKNAIQIQEEIEHTRKDERLIGAMQIMKQIGENEQKRLLDLEMKDQENKLMQKYLDKLCEEEAEKLEKKREEQHRLRDDLNQCNDDIIMRREVNKEQEKMLDAKVLEFQQKKAEREQAYELEQERIRIDKEREVARLRALQERAKDEQAERDELRAKRAQEKAEREWRKKEETEARKKAETEAMLKHARAHQMEQKEHFLAVQAQRERAEFERVLHAQQELVEKDRREESAVTKRRSKYADDVRKQISEKEQLRISERNAFFDEGVKLDEEARQRRQKLEEIKKKKLEELRAIGIHEKYLSQVERKVNQPQHVMA